MGNEKAFFLQMDCEPCSGNVRKCTAQCTGEDLRDEFEGKASVHQDSGLSPQHHALCFVTVNWKVQSVCLYKEIGDALDRCNCRGLKLMVQAMKVIERIAYSLVKQVMTIDWGTLGEFLCRWHCHYCILRGRICS